MRSESIRDMQIIACASDRGGRAGGVCDRIQFLMYSPVPGQCIRFVFIIRMHSCVNACTARSVRRPRTNNMPLGIQIKTRVGVVITIIMCVCARVFVWPTGTANTSLCSPRCVYDKLNIAFMVWKRAQDKLGKRCLFKIQPRARTVD